MIMVSLLSMLTTQSATTGVLACYVVIFACLLCCFETHLKQVSKIIALNFGFMYSAKSRAAFMIFIGKLKCQCKMACNHASCSIGTIMFSFSLFGKLIGLVMLGNAGFNIFILFKYPQFEDAQRNHAQSEIKDYLAANPAFAQQIMQASVTAGVDLFKSNPGILLLFALINSFLNYFCVCRSCPARNSGNVRCNWKCTWKWCLFFIWRIFECLITLFVFTLKSSVMRYKAPFL